MIAYDSNTTNPSKPLMNKTTMLGLAVMTVGTWIVPTLAESEPESPSPLKQYNSGIPIEDIQCNRQKILVESPDKRPACVNESSVDRLQSIGYAIVDLIKETASSVFEFSVLHFESGDVLHAKNNHPWPVATLDIPDKFKIGEPFEVTLRYWFFTADETGKIDEQYLLEDLKLWHEEDKKIRFIFTDEVDLISPDGFDKDVHASERHVDKSITYTKDLVYTTDQVITETVQFVINEPIHRTSPNFDICASDFVCFKFWLESNSDGTVDLRTEKPQQDHSELEQYKLANADDASKESFGKKETCEQYNAENIKYQSFTSTNHSMTAGKLLDFCIEPNYKWYVIHLETQEPGSLTITVPKDIADLKQFDYESCLLGDLMTNVKSDGTATVTQTAQTDTARTLEFTWSQPITSISYFGTHAIFDGIDYSEPNHCIKMSENEENNAKIEGRDDVSLQRSDSKVCGLHLCPEYQDDKAGQYDPMISRESFNKYIPPSSYCNEEIDLDYDISNGAVEKICIERYNSISIIFFINDVTSPGKLEFNNSYDYHRMEDNNFEVGVLANNQEIPHLVTVVNHDDFQSFEIELLPNTRVIEIIYLSWP